MLRMLTRAKPGGPRHGCGLATIWIDCRRDQPISRYGPLPAECWLSHSVAPPDRSCSCSAAFSTMLNSGAAKRRQDRLVGPAQADVDAVGAADGDADDVGNELAAPVHGVVRPRDRESAILGRDVGTAGERSGRVEREAPAGTARQLVPPRRQTGRHVAILAGCQRDQRVVRRMQRQRRGVAGQTRRIEGGDVVDIQTDYQRFAPCFGLWRFGARGTGHGKGRRPRMQAGGRETVRVCLLRL